MGMTTAVRRGPDWLVPAGLLALAAIPVIAGAFRVGTLAGGAEVTPDNARFHDMPVPVVVHIVGATLYSILGAFQFHPGLRRRRPRWHRLAGRVLVPAGLAVALSGIWMTLFYPLPDSDNTFTNAQRLVVGGVMAGAIVAGFAAIRRRDVRTHRAWMIRAYALAMGAGTQAFTHGFYTAFAGTPDADARAWCMFAGWFVNIVVAELSIKRRLI